MGTPLKYAVTRPAAFLVNSVASTSVCLCKLEVIHYVEEGELELWVYPLNVGYPATKRHFMVFNVVKTGSNTLQRLQQYLLYMHQIFIDDQTMRVLLRNVNHPDAYA